MLSATGCSIPVRAGRFATFACPTLLGCAVDTSCTFVWCFTSLVGLFGSSLLDPAMSWGCVVFFVTSPLCCFSRIPIVSACVGGPPGHSVLEEWLCPASCGLAHQLLSSCGVVCAHPLCCVQTTRNRVVVKCSRVPLVVSAAKHFFVGGTPSACSQRFFGAANDCLSFLPSVFKSPSLCCQHNTRFLPPLP